MSEQDRRALEDAIRSLPRRTAPPGWQARVLAAIDEPRAVRRRWLGWPWLAAGLVAAAAALLIWLGWRRPIEHREFALVTGVEAGPTVVRGDGAKVGDTWVVEATLGVTPQPAVEARAWDLRIYGDQTLVASCSRGDCAATDDHVSMKLTLRAAGAYRALLLWGSALPPTLGELDRDVAEAAKAGAQTKLSPALEVAPFGGPR